jgi:glycosyltransferase involved in cell wall biosynthesis
MGQPFLIDAGPMGGGVSGTGRYAFKMLDELLDMEREIQFKILLPPGDEHDWGNPGWADKENVELLPADITGAGPKRQFYYLRNSFDYSVHHSLSSYVPIFLNGNGTTLVTIHDLKHVKIPGLFDGFSRIKRAYVTKMIARSVMEADHIITVSEHTKSDLIDHYGITGSNVSVVPLGPGDVRPDIEGDPPVSPPYLLFVGMVLRHKNVHVLVEAFNEYRRRTDSTVDLVIAGSPSEEYLDELTEAIDPAYQESVHFLGYVPDDTLARLYKHATAFVFPSLYEGFGIPPLEAMGYGTPVIASDRASIPEVVGDAGEYFDASDPSELADVLIRVLSSETRRAELAEAGYKRFNEFTWKRTATETLDIYRDYV